MSPTEHTPPAGAIEAARRQLAWLPLDTLLPLIKDARAGLEIEEAFVAELCKTWRECQPSMGLAQVELNARAVMLLARHGT